MARNSRIDRPISLRHRLAATPLLPAALFATLLIAFSAPTLADSTESQAVAAVLDDFHRAAAEADGDRYFAHFADDAIFLGTDPGERWTLEEFRSFAEPYFSAGRGWTYVPAERHVVLAEEAPLAWFDELLDNESYGRCRGSGVLRKTADGWKLVQYNLTMVIPNDFAKSVAAMIRGDRTASEQ